MANHRRHYKCPLKSDEVCRVLSAELYSKYRIKIDKQNNESQAPKTS